MTIHTNDPAEAVRAHRLFIGLGQREMARRLHMDRRTLQRIEAGTDPCPPGVLDDARDLSDDFGRQVDAVLDEAERRDPADGPLPLSVVTNGNDADEWLRLVAGRAMVETPDTHPIVLVVETAHQNTA
ncbi:helix-turn-helix DNA binding domain protein [Mycobacterium phage Knocker]|nr:helix-turn-helix DNA binding domain protein [Mycobacterium phage Knocker]